MDIICARLKVAEALEHFLFSWLQHPPLFASFCAKSQNLCAVWILRLRFAPRRMTMAWCGM